MSRPHGRRAGIARGSREILLACPVAPGARRPGKNGERCRYGGHSGELNLDAGGELNLDTGGELD